MDANFTNVLNNSEFTNTDHVIIGSYLISVGILAVIGNGLLLAAIIRFPVLRTPTHMLIGCLAFTDLCMSLFGFPFAAASNFANRWIFGHFGCQWYGFNGMLFGFSNIGMLTIISIDRYIVTCRRDKDPASLHYHYAFLVGLAWFNALTWALMPILGWGRYDVEPSGCACTIAWWYNDAAYVSYVMAAFVLCFMLPITVMCYCYVRVIGFVRKVGGDIRHENVEWTNEKNITKMSVTCVVLFLVAWLPYAIVCLWAIWADPSTIPAKLSAIPALFAKSSAFYNPIVYAVTNRRMRRAVFALFRGENHANSGIESVPMASVKTIGRNKKHESGIL